MQFNRAAANLLGIAENSGPKLMLADFFAPEHDYTAWMRSLFCSNIAQTELNLRLRGRQIRVIAHAVRISDEPPHLLLCLANITENYNRRKQLERLAATDDMTGLLNRRAFRESLASALIKLREDQNEFFLAFMDLDGLKKVNDIYGHREGDWYINTFAALVGKSLRETDIAGRVGGDEFAVIYTQCQRRYAEQAIRNLQQQLQITAKSLEKPYAMGASIGLIAVQSWLEIDADSLLAIADDAMYKQKYRLGRQKVIRIDKNKRRR